MGRREGGNVHEVREYDTVFERASDPDEIQRILINIHLTRQTARIITAQPGATVWIDADAEIADASLHGGAADDVGDGGGDAWCDLCGAVDWWVGLVVEGDEEDAGDQRRGGGAAC